MLPLPSGQAQPNGAKDGEVGYGNADQAVAELTDSPFVLSLAPVPDSSCAASTDDNGSRGDANGDDWGINVRVAQAQASGAAKKAANSKKKGGKKGKKRK